MNQQVTQVVENEKEAFRRASRELMAATAVELGITCNLDQCVVVVGASLAKKYVQACQTGLALNKAVLIAGRGPAINRAVAVAEQVKQLCQPLAVQATRAGLQSSLINPSYKAQASSKNVQVFFADDDSQNASFGESVSERDVQREIAGHKVYKVPTITVLLLKEQVPKGQLGGWTSQAAF